MSASGTGPSSLAQEARAEADRLDREIQEIDLLMQQARVEATRHEERRAHAAERFRVAESRGPAGFAEVGEAVQGLVAATRRASLMETQVDVLEGKRRALDRFRERMRAIATAADAGGASDGRDDGSGAHMSSRTLLTAQEDLRRDIARRMHDGPAQSLANIALHAQIVQRLVSRDPERAVAEASQLVAMVEGTLDATKSFIFDVRPMVLDDLGLVATMRRVSRERGRRSRLPIEFDSVGVDRRLPEDAESGLYRIVDEAITGYLETNPARIAVKFDWSDDALRVRVSGLHSDDEPTPAPEDEPSPEPASSGGGFRLGRRRTSDKPADVLPALVAMIEEEHADRAAEDAASRDALTEARTLPTQAWRQIQQRARTIGCDVRLLDAGQTVETVAPIEPAVGGASQHRY